METPPITPPQINAETRQAILQREIAQYAGQGYVIVSQMGYSAQLRKPKKFSLLWSIFWLIFGLGIGFVIYILYYLAKRDELIYVEVMPSGSKNFQHTGSLSTSAILLLIGSAIFLFGCAVCVVSSIVAGSIDPEAILTALPPTP